MNYLINKLSKIEYRIIGILLLALTFRIQTIYNPYWGLEYEDSYIFSVTSRLLNNSYDFNYDLFYTKYVSLGSVSEAIKMSTISGHYIFFPTILSLINTIFNYAPTNVLYVNTFFSLLNIFILLKTYRIAYSEKGILLFGVVISTIPFLSIYNTSGLSETFSSVILSSTIYAFLKCSKTNYENNFHSLVLVLIISISIMVKRDNLILLSWPVLESLKYYLNKNYGVSKKIGLITISIIVLSIVLGLLLDVQRTIIDERNDIGMSPFSVTFLIELLPIFLTSLFKFKFFGVTGIFLVISLIIAIIKKDYYLFILPLIFFAFIGVYSIHYRSYYMIHGDFEPSTFDTFRYYTNFISISILYSCIFINKHLIPLLERRKTITYFILFIYIVINFSNTHSLRKNYSDEEYVVRFKPVLKTLDLIEEKDIIITDIPILFQLLANRDLKMVDINHLNDYEFEYIDRNKSNKKVYALLSKNPDYRYNKKGIFESRYNLKFIKDISEEYELYIIKQ